MPFLLIVFLTLACLPELDKVLDKEGRLLPVWGGTPRPDWVPATGLSALLTWSAVFFMVAWAWWISRRVGRALETDPAGRDRVLQRYETGRWRPQSKKR